MVRQATGHTVGIQNVKKSPIVFVHVDELIGRSKLALISSSTRMDTSRSVIGEATFERIV